MGLLVPGELTVVLGGAIARDGDISIVRALRLVWLAAVAGDTTGYLLGRRLGLEFLVRHGPRFHITPDVIARVEGDLRPARRQGHHPRPLHRRRARDHAVPGRHARTSRCGASWRSTSPGPAPGRRRSLPSATSSRRAPSAPPRSRTRSACDRHAAVVGAVAIGVRQLYRSAPRGRAIRRRAALAARRADPREARKRPRPRDGAAPPRALREALASGAQAARADADATDGGDPSEPRPSGGCSDG